MNKTEKCHLIITYLNIHVDCLKSYCSATIILGTKYISFEMDILIISAISIKFKMQRKSTRQINLSDNHFN